ncbi:hypothetical protein LC065_07520 [Halobacillus litoralis]|uniref:hypothetical protein n=1 Tax=Halobacillus litoralis TaxID=45668 RepID=UPI00273DEA7D|nr:hypothetical protein [Halobacillus litoralis]WLR49001.1 hypothetical protein LC065_07520 [Halobacillus litoralis]
MDYKQAVNNSGSANVLVAALATKNWPLAGKMMQSDRWHQPYRQILIPGFSSFKGILEKEHSLGHYISGAGPTTVALFDEWDDSKRERLELALEDYQVEPLQVDLSGAETLVLTPEK